MLGRRRTWVVAVLLIVAGGSAACSQHDEFAFVIHFPKGSDPGWADELAMRVEQAGCEKSEAILAKPISRSSAGVTYRVRCSDGTQVVGRVVWVTGPGSP